MLTCIRVKYIANLWKLFTSIFYNRESLWNDMIIQYWTSFSDKIISYSFMLNAFCTALTLSLNNTPNRQFNFNQFCKFTGQWTQIMRLKSIY
jgi:hypothetical protein